MTSIGPAGVAAGAMIAAAFILLFKSKAARVATAAFLAATAGQVIGAWVSELELADIAAAGAATSSWVEAHRAIVFGAAAFVAGAAMNVILKRWR